VKAVSANIVWACGEKGTVIRSTDGGVTWLFTTPLVSSLDCFSIEARDANTAWVAADDLNAGGSALYKTTNGGSTWIQQLISNSPGTFYNAVKFYDGNNGILMGDPENGYFVIQTTTNGGTTWTRTPSANIPAPLSGEYSNPNSLAIFGNAAWFGTGAATEGSTRVFRSTDRGKSWTVSGIISGLGTSLWSSAFGNESAGIVLGRNGYYVRTTNGGSTWSAPLLEPGKYISEDATFASPTSIVLVGFNGESNVSTDAGLSWSSRATADTMDLYSVSFASSADGWAVGQAGVVYRWSGETMVGPPWVVTLSPSNVGPTYATVNSVGNPNGSSSNIYFEWGTNAALTPSTTTTSEGIGSGTDAVLVTARLTGLTPNTTYFVRAAGQNPLGTQKGGVLSFTTTAGAGDPYEPNSSYDRGFGIPYGFKSAGAEIGVAGDVDYYKFNGASGDFIAIEVVTDPLPGLDVRVSLYDAAGAELVGNDMVSTGTERILYGINRPGVYYIRIAEAQNSGAFPTSLKKKAQTKGTASSTGPYTLSLTNGASVLAPLFLSAASNFEGMVPIRWDPPSANSPASYRIYRSISQAGPYDAIGISPREYPIFTESHRSTVPRTKKAIRPISTEQHLVPEDSNSLRELHR
jgi:photosystem II stability/assembly factor-like uncharacterized protein